MHLLNRPSNGVIVAKNSDLKMLYTLLPSLSTNCKNAMLKLTQNTLRKVIATNGSEVCKIGHHYPVLACWGWGSCSRWRLVGSLIFQSGLRFEEKGQARFHSLMQGKFHTAEYYGKCLWGNAKGRRWSFSTTFQTFPSWFCCGGGGWR